MGVVWWGQLVISVTALKCLNDVFICCSSRDAVQYFSSLPFQGSEKMHDLLQDWPVLLNHCLELVMKHNPGHESIKPQPLYPIRAGCCLLATPTPCLGFDSTVFWTTTPWLLSASLSPIYLSPLDLNVKVSCGGPGSTGRQLPSSILPHTGPRRGSVSAGWHDIFHLFTYPVCDGLFKSGLCRLEGTYCGPHPFLTSTYSSPPVLLGLKVIQSILN